MTRKQIGRLAKALQAAEKSRAEWDPRVFQAMEAGIRSLIGELEEKMVTICKECKHFQVRRHCHNFDDYWETREDSCTASNAPHTEFVRGLKQPHLINTGECAFYEPKEG